MSVARPLVDALVRLALEEDLALGDVTSESTIPANRLGEGHLAAKQALVLAGVDVATRVFAAVDPAIAVTWHASDGDAVLPKMRVATARGPLRSLLMAERTTLNFLQRLSGIATLTRAYVDAVAGTHASVVDTRKTTPGLRVLEKEAVRAGGGHNHRASLGAGVLIKDNHVDCSGGDLAETVRRARAGAAHSLIIEVEVRTLAEVDLALGSRADMLLLDNMSLDVMAEAVRRATNAGVRTEASGGVRLDTIAAIARTGVDLISVGALTHSAVAVDLHLKTIPLP